MAKSISDYFNVKTLPASGNFSIAHSTPQSTYVPAPTAVPVKNPALNKPVPSSLSQLSLPVAPVAPITRPPGSPIGTPNPSASPIFTPSTTGPDRAPVGPEGATGTTIPPQYLNPDGSFKTPDDIAAGIGSSLKAAHGNPDIGTLSAEQFGDTQGKTAAELAVEARRINNTRNDIAVGETDPYKIASQSGIQYTPAELSAIEKAYAGIYDPALDTAMQKVQAKQKADEAAASGGFTLGKDQVRYDAQGNPIAIGISSDDGSGGGVYVKGANPVVDAYVEGSKLGTYKPSDIPDQYKDLVAQGVAGGGKAAQSKNTIDAISNINQLLADPNSIEYVTGGSNLNPLTLLPGAQEAPARNLLNQLAGTLALQNRQQLKGSGAISDFEFRVLQQAASDLGVQANGTSNLSPAALKAGLEKLKLKLEVGPTTLTDDELLYLKSKGYTAEDIQQYDEDSGKVSVGNTSASTGNIPQRNNNPGNVKAGGLADSLAVGKDKYGHLIFPDAQTGFKALTADLTAKINGGSSRLPANPTIAQLGKVYAEDPNWPVKVAAMVGVPVDTHTKNIPLANLVKAIATQEGFYA